MKINKKLILYLNFLLLIVFSVIVYYIIKNIIQIAEYDQSENSVVNTIPTPTKYVAKKTNLYVDPLGNDSQSGQSIEYPFKNIQKAISIARPGDVINLAPGVYIQDFVTENDGVHDNPIIITGPASAIVKGDGRSRIAEINHSFIHLIGFTIDGQYLSNKFSKDSYRDKLIYVLGKNPRIGVTGIKILNMNLQNAAGECVRFRYFVQNSDFAFNTVSKCGIADFAFPGGGKNGEGLYIGTAPEQRHDGKNATTDPDNSNNNWVHHNKFNTEGNECVDIKEGSSGNIIEYNFCTGQKDPESGGMDSRGDSNTFRFNEITGNLGAGIRFGGDSENDGIMNNAYKNIITNNRAGGIKFQRFPQNKVCANTMSGNSRGNSAGEYRSKFTPAADCTGQ